MAKFDYPNPSFASQLEIIGVVWPALTIDGNGVAEVTFYCPSTGRRETVRVGLESMKTVFGPYLTGDKDQKIIKLEEQALKDAEVYYKSNAGLSQALDTAKAEGLEWRKQRDRCHAEVQRLEKVCLHWHTQLRESKSAQITLQKIVLELQTPGMAKERDEYSKAIDKQNVRVATLETKVAKLEKAAEVPEDGFPIETCPKTDFQANNRVMLFMGGQWVEGGRNYKISGPRRGDYSSIYSPLRSMEWDRNNQPTRWQPLPK